MRGCLTIRVILYSGKYGVCVVLTLFSLSDIIKLGLGKDNEILETKILSPKLDIVRPRAEILVGVIPEIVAIMHSQLEPRHKIKTELLKAS